MESRAPQERAQPLFIVGVGASAGGLEALQRLFDAVRPTGRLAFVVVQHLSPDFKSLMDELLARHTSLAIHRAEDGMEVEPDALYLLPPKKEMTIAGGKLVLRDREPEAGLSLPIDVFFSALAADAGPRAVAVVLSGTGTDGSRGVRAVHEAGGLVLAQSEDSAKFDGMPRSAIETGLVDFVQPPEGLGAALVRLAERGQHLADPGGERAGDRGELERILELLRKECGVDFSGYKSTTVTRRIERRALLGDARDVAEYLARLERDPGELRSLYKDLLIGVTRFFRDAEAFERLRRDVFPSILDRLPSGDELRLWVAGCATGEEAYSLGLLALEAFRERGRLPALKLFATDIHRASLEFASPGVYPAEAVAHVPPDLRERYFERHGDHFQVSQELRTAIVFAHHNLLRDAPFTRLDLVSCRNLLIYLKPAAQRKIISAFHFALKPSGVMFLGPSEAPGAFADEFVVLDGRWKLFRKRRDVRLAAPDLPVHPAGDGGPRVIRPGPHDDPRVKSARETLLQRYVPPTLAVDESFNLLHAFNGAGRYLAQRDGQPTLHLLDLLAGELKFVVAAALKRAVKERTSASYSGVSVAHPGAPAERVRVTVTPVDGGARSDDAFLVTLEPEREPERAAAPANDSAADLGELERERVAAMEQELRQTRENLQATVEEMQTGNEELQATNEELIASNEELQSTNEELHSVNEELYTVNAEYQAKIAELTELTADMNHLLEATQVHTLFLDHELRLRRFTPRMGELFNLLPQDLGRPIEGFAYGLDHKGLIDDLRKVLATAEVVERDVSDRRGGAYLLRVLPYRPAQVVDGVVVTLIDVSALKRALGELTASEARYREKSAQLQGILDNSPAFVWAKDLAGRYLIASRTCEDVLAHPLDEVIGRTDAELLPPAVAEALGASERRVRERGETVEVEDTLARAGEPRTYLTVKFPLRDPVGAVTAVAGIATDITERKRAAEESRLAVQRRDHLLAMLSHELRTPLGAILNCAELLARSEAEPGARRPLDIIRRQSRHMSRLLDDLLDVARLTRNQLRVEKGRVDLAVVVRDAVHAAQPAAEKKGLVLALRDPPAPLPVHGDAVRLQQVVSNLLSNAIRYTHAGHIEVEAGVEGGEAVVRIDDTGVGMSREELGHAFELFYQAPQALDRSAGGLGVGLSLAQRLVELHGGRISAESAGRDRGSSFAVRLPLMLEGDDAAPRDGAARGPPRKLRVAVVEDSDDIRETMKDILELEGHEVIQAANGMDGAALIVAERPHVALVDVGLPGLDGYGVARHVREALGRGVRLVALTGYGRPEDRAAAAAAGFDAHAVKPVEAERLLRLVDDEPQPGPAAGASAGAPLRSC